MDEIDYKEVSASLATQLAEQIYQTAQWRNLAEKSVAERNSLRAKLASYEDTKPTKDEDPSV